MPARRSTSPESRAPSRKASAARARSLRLAPRGRRSTACAKRRLEFPDDSDADALHDDVALVDAQRLHRIVGGLQPDPAAGLAVKPFDRGTLSVDERDHRLA